MSDRGRRIWLASVGIAAACLTFAAVAWACSPTADLQIDHVSGASGTPLTFFGHRFAAGRVEIRMDSVSSVPIATATGPDFSLTISVPNTTPGYHVFGAVGYDASGSVVGQNSVSFRVTGGTPAPRPPGQPVVHRQPGLRAAHHPVPGTTHTHRGGSSAPVDQSHLVGGQPVSPPPAAVVSVAAQPAQRAVAPATTVPSVLTSPVISASRTRVPARILPNRHGLSAPGGSAAPPKTPSGAHPAAGGLWAPNPEGSSGGGATGGGLPIALGAGLLAVGLVALFGGFTVAEVRRRRALARSRRS